MESRTVKTFKAKESGEVMLVEYLNLQNPTDRWSLVIRVDGKTVVIMDCDSFAQANSLFSTIARCARAIY